MSAPLTAARHGKVVVGISDLAVSDDAQTVITTHALGSCIAVILFDPTHRVGGLLHYMLPVSKTAPEKAKLKPAMFADTGVPMLFRAMYALGASKADIIVKVAGGAQLFDDAGAFRIGARNFTVLRKIFWKAGVVIENQDVGGTISRTVSLRLEDGAVAVRSSGKEWSL